MIISDGRVLALCILVKVKAIGEGFNARDRVRLVESVLYSNVGPENAVYQPMHYSFSNKTLPHVMYCHGVWIGYGFIDH
jgi:hypothetical protein